MKNPCKYIVIVAAAVLAAGSVAVAASSSFSDVASDHPQLGDIEYAVAQGWFQGYGDGTFKPDRAVTQKQITTVIGRAFPEGLTRADLATFLRGGTDRLAANRVTVTSATASSGGTAPGGGSDGGGGGGPSEPVVNPVAAAADPIAGTWTIYEGVAGSFAGFRVDEDLTFGDVTVVGRTEGVSGFIRISAGRLEATEVTVDMSGIEAYRPMRGRLIHRALATDRFPTSTFVQTESVALPANAADGVAFSLEAKGDMTIKGITNPVVFALEVQLTDNGIVIVGSAGVRYDDFGVRAPSVPIAVSIKDHGTVEFQLLFTR